MARRDKLLARMFQEVQTPSLLGLGAIDTIADAEESLSNSLKTLKTDYVDILYFHNLGDRLVDKSRDPDGVFTWLLKQKQAGKCRFVGISGHNLPERFPPFLESGDVDVVLLPVNFVDRYTYGFEEKILPVAVNETLFFLVAKVSSPYLVSLFPSDT